MARLNQNWALVLAAGEGRRLAGMTTDPNGRAVPKQYCSLSGDMSMLQETLARAHRIALPERTVVIVADEHRRWWSKTLRPALEQNTIVQPRNRGTGIGVLLPLLHILDRDPDANVILLPSDHYIHDEAVLGTSIQRALEHLAGDDGGIVLLGIAPDRFDSELGYIVPGKERHAGVHSVQTFIEKPEPELAALLGTQRAVWNSFIIVAKGTELLDLYAEGFPEIVIAMAQAMRSLGGRDDLALKNLYDALPEIDFSRHVIADATKRLRLLRVPQCGWSDLGTPQRVAQVLARIMPVSERTKTRARPSPVGQPLAFLRLADAAFQLAG